MDSHDIERLARLARTAAGLGVSLALMPVRLALRAVWPSPPAEEERWAPVEPEPEPMPERVPEPMPLRVPEPEPEPEPVPPSPHVRDLTAAQAARRREAAREAQTTPDSPGPELRVEEPWPGYDAMNIAQVLERLTGADPTLRAMVRLYEETHKSRKGVLRATE